MNSKSNRSYKLRTKQMAIHVRAFGQVNKSVVTTKVEERLFTIDDLREGRCAIYNDTDSVDELQAILDYAFPEDSSISGGYYNYYFAFTSYQERWNCADSIDLPIQSAIKFFNQINK